MIEGDTELMNQTTLKKRVKQYLSDTGIPRTSFCKRVHISTTYLYKWLHDKRTFSEDVAERIDEYLKRFNY